ncbi:bifunctional precorrin-2 dehydrogenase/sirohydrochlorin ferrochelatase [Chloroflexota bacterium]
MKSKRSRYYYPVFLNISGRKCVVVGGGQVALRKAKGLLEFGANVEVISPDLCSELNELAETGEINVLRRRYQAGDLQGALMSIAATNNSDINQEVVKEARRGGVLVNVVDDAEDSAFIVPSCLRRGNITIAVSTAGSSPALARKIRTRLEKDLGDEYASLSLLVEEVRSELKRQGIKVNSDGWQKALDLDLMIDLLKKRNKERAKAALLDNLKALQK